MVDGAEAVGEEEVAVGCGVGAVVFEFYGLELEDEVVAEGAEEAEVFIAAGECSQEQNRHESRHCAAL